jgi:phage gp46-like protein
MQDLSFVMNDNGLIVLAIRDGDLIGVDGMETALQVSIFTDARLDESEMPDPVRRGGWLGNVFSGRQLGGKLHALENARVSTAYVGKAKEFASRSLDWMIEDGVSRGVVCNVSANQQTIMHNIAIVGRDGVKYDYRYLWAKTRPFSLRIA